MPPNLDVYAISSARDRETIERFLTMYVNRATSEDRGDEQLMILALEASGKSSNADDWDWEPSESLTHIIERGLQYPRRAFSVYLKAQDASLAGAILSFTTDDQVIFGVSLEDEGAKPENLERAKMLLHEMVKAFGGHRGFIGVETPPPSRGVSDAPKILVYSWEATSKLP
jgi:hypothetical protein